MIKLKVQPDDADEFTVVADSRDIYVWEKTGKNRSVSDLLKSMSMAGMYEVAHIASKRQGLFTGTLDEMTRTCQLTFDSDDEVDPTQAAALLEQ